MQRTKSKILSILLSLVMLLSLLPTTALAASPDASNVYVDGGKNFYNSTRLYYINGDSDGNFTGNASNYNAAYDPATGTLTLKDYNGKGITVGGVGRTDITVVLEGTNIINDGSLENAVGGDITVTSSDGGTLSITRTLSGGNAAIGIETGLSGSYTTGSVTIKGDAEVTIDMTHTGTSTYEKAYGIYAKENITISENASVDITCATPNNTTGGSNCNGMFANGNVSIDTTGKIKIDVTKAGKDDAYSFGIYPMGTPTLTRVGEMQVQWKKHSTHSSYPGGAISRGASFDTTTHAVNVDTTNCYASYRKGTPYTVTVQNGTLTGPGVKYANGSGYFLAGDKVNITPATKKGRSGEEIPFKEWTSKDVTFTNSTSPSNSFTVPGKDVTVTATHSPFVGTPTFTPIGMTGTEGTLTFKTKVTLGDGNESFALVKEVEVDDTTKYKSINPSTTSPSSPYEYSSTVIFNNFSEGNYYVAEKLNGAWYLSEKFTVSYTAAPTPAANISLSQTSTMDFGSLEAGYTTAPAVKTVTITNNGTAATGQLTIALDGANKTAFTLSKTSITDIAASGTDTFTVQPNPGLTAGSYNATVKVSGTGVTEQSFGVKFTVTAPATPITDTLVPVSDLTGKTYNESAQEPTFGGSLTLGTDYTVSYAVKPGSTGALDGGKPKDAGTYVVTVAGKGSYTGSFDKDFKIDKANPTYTAPTAKAGLAYTGSALDLIDAGTVTKGGEMQYKLSGGSYGLGIPVATNAGDYTVYFKIDENDNYNAVAETQVGTGAINIAQVEWGTPTEALASVNPTTVGGSDGQITGTTSAMQYKKSTESGWTNCSGDVTGLTAGTYYVRYKADSNHTASDTNYKTVTLTDPGATLYSVTVTDGTASPSGDQAAGAEVAITANAKTGFNFKEWTGLADGDYKPGFTKASNPATFIMPASAVNVTATYDPAALTGTVNITGTAKFGQTLTADTIGITNNTGTLTYKWYRGSDEIIGATGSTYTLVEDDIGKTITVKVSSTVQTGEIPSAATAAVGKADGPTAPSAFTLTFTLNADGTTFTATIPTVTGGEYSFDGATYSTTNTKTDCAANTTYTGYARVKETATHKTGTEISDTQTSPKLTVATPTFTPNGVSSFTGTQSVKISCTTVGATIHYTTDGTAPTASSPVYSTELSLTSTTTVTAIAVKAGMNDSATATATFTKYSGGGGGGGGSYTPSYTVSVDKTENGTITVSPKSASKGDTVTITVKPDKGYELEMLKALDKDGDALKLTEKNGKYTFKMPSGKVTVKGSFVEEAPEQIFKDVPTDAYYYEAVKWAAEKGITGGVGNGLFAPNQPCTRAQIVTFLWRAAGSPAPKNMSSFADVPADAFYAKAVAWAVENGITGGTGDGKFSPDATCTRAQSVTFLYRAAGSPKVSSSAEFGDVATNAYYADAVAWAAKNGITGGIGGGLFGSGNDCTRGQIVTFLYRNYQSK